MKLSEFKLNYQPMIEVEIEEDITLAKEGMIDIFLEDEQFFISQDNYTLPIDVYFNSINSEDSVKYLIQNNRTLWFLARQKHRKIWLQPISMDGETLRIDSIDIGVDNYLVEQLTKNINSIRNNQQQALTWLNEEFLLEINNTTKLGFLASYANDNNHHQEITLIGRSYRCQITAINDYWQIKQVNPLTNIQDLNLVNITGNLHFVDATLAKQFNNPLSKKQLEQHIEQYGDYIQIWKEYSQMQEEQVKEDASALGYIDYTDAIHAPVPYIWHIHADPEKIQKFRTTWEGLEGSQEKKVQISFRLPSWLQTHKKEDRLDKDDKPWLAEILSFESHYLVIKFLDRFENRKPADKGYLFYSIQGALVQSDRQKHALEKISSGNNPLKSLHHLLQGHPVTMPHVRSKKLSWKSPKTKANFKKGMPTIKQREAIELALNSQDLTLIIGPPGTGKTQVITALQQRIIEEAKDIGIEKSVLLTSFQHDAVENALARSNVMGLAGLRVGGKNQSFDSENDQLSTIEKWAKPIQSNLSAIISKQDITQLVQQLELATLDLRLGTIEQKYLGKSNIDRLLLLFSEKYQILPSSAWQQWWEIFDIKQSSLVSNFLKKRLPYIWGLRTTKEAFLDDGGVNCFKVLNYIGSIQTNKIKLNILTTEDELLLNKLSLSKNPEHQDLIALEQLKNKLLDLSLPSFLPLNHQIILSDNDCRMLDNLVSQIKSKILASKTLGYLMVLEEYNQILYSRPKALKKTIINYTAVLGATCQQAAGKEMLNLKEINKIDSQDIIFDNVIVDEAARATPLDLMIPMAMAKKRLVLVGDHRQLPHLLDDSVEKGMNEDRPLEERESLMLKTSLFQRLVEDMTRLEKDNLQIKRVIMLDTQFRMHRLLGDFISRNFYENKGLPRIKTGKSDEDFDHQALGYENLVCAWKNIGGEAENRPKNGNGWHRPSEASWIAKETKRLLDNHPRLSIGVISFYAGQVQTIMNAMKTVGLVNGDNQIHVDYRTLYEGENQGDERLRVGTVDAFQGKEFDIVFVSLVRTVRGDFYYETLDSLQQKPIEIQERLLNATYGFLRVDNRLNVALSRQRSLLIMVGDKTLAEHPVTSQVIPALNNFLIDLCKREHGKVF